MPKSIFPVNQREITITRSAIRSVVKDLAKAWNYPKDYDIRFNELQGAQKFRNGKLVPCSQEIDTDNDNYIFVDFEERFAGEGYKPDTVSKNNHKALFWDNELGVHVKPHMATMIVETTLRFRCRNLTDINAFRNSLKVKATESHVMERHDIFYDYNIPDEILYLTNYIYNLRENHKGYGQSLKEYYKEHFRDSVTTRRNQTGTHVQPISQECQNGVVGIMRDKQQYTVIEVSEGVYEINVPYEFHYQQPVAVEIGFPLFIHNQFIGKKILQAYDPVRNVSALRKGWKPIEYLSTGSKDIERYYRADGGTRYVEFDDYFPDNIRENTQTLTLIPIKVSDENPNNVINIDTIPEKLLPTIVKDFLRKFWKYGGKAIMSLIHIEVFENYGFERSLDFTIDEDLNVRTLATMDSRYRNYLRISIMRDWSLVPNETIKELLCDAVGLFELAKLLDKKLELYHAGSHEPNRKVNHFVVKDGCITKESVTDWLVTLPFVNNAFKNAPGGFMRTVQTSGLTAARRQ